MYSGVNIINIQTELIKYHSNELNNMQELGIS